MEIVTRGYGEARDLDFLSEKPSREMNKPKERNTAKMKQSSPQCANNLCFVANFLRRGRVTVTAGTERRPWVDPPALSPPPGTPCLPGCLLALRGLPVFG